MKYNEFKSRFQNYPLIFTKHVIIGSDDPQNQRNQFNRWVHKGLLIRLRRGMYIFNRHDRKTVPDLNYIANQLYEPSYVSLEYALNFYGLIPEAVKDVTSVTTRKTNIFRNEFGVFNYGHVKPQAFRGFKKMGDAHMPFYMAEPEKAVVDFVYLHLSRFGKNTRNVFEESYRFQNIEVLDQGRLMQLGGVFQNKKLLKVLNVLCCMINEERS